MKIAIVHDWFVTYAGAERVVEQMLKVLPESDLFAVVDFIPPAERGFLANKEVKTTFIQSLPWARKKYRSYLPLMPFAVEQLDLSEYDVVISSSAAVAKGVITGPGQIHIAYINSPIRYAWDLTHQYLREGGLGMGPKGLLARLILHYIRIWDLRTAPSIDVMLANSGFIGKRIWKVYRRESKVLYPPVNVEKFSLREDKEDFYLTASRMVPYKKMDLIVEAFAAMPERQLVVIGDGPEMPKVRARAEGHDNIKILGFQPDEVLRDYLQRAKCFLFAAEEDFGIAPLEAQACGTPVIAYGRGGALETIRGLGRSESPTGLFFKEQTVPSVCRAVAEFEENMSLFTPAACRENALRFSPERFREEFRQVVENSLAQGEEHD
ncbi:MAG: glycosyltransferase family 4 protein [Selenomonas ruminantium]|nr:glycosyltransferase family 4 protein [Selenomonas ruminantium]